MFILVPILVVLSLAIITIKFFIANNSYEKILSFYFIFSNIIILITMSAINHFDSILDIIILLFLLKLVTMLFLLFNKKKI